MKGALFCMATLPAFAESCVFMQNVVNHHNHPRGVARTGEQGPDAPAWEDSAEKETAPADDDPTGEMGRATVKPPTPFQRIGEALTPGQGGP